MGDDCFAVVVDLDKWLANRVDRKEGATWLKGTRRPWSKDEAAKVARYEARRVAHEADATSGPDIGVAPDPDFPETLELLADPDSADPAVVGTVRVRKLRCALAKGRYGPLVHPALEKRR